MSAENTLDVVMPQMGVSVSEGVVATWHVKVGDQVSNEQLVCDVTTDKTDVEVLSPADGVIIEIVVPEGETVEVGYPMARMSTSGATTSGEAEPSVTTAALVAEAVAPASAPRSNEPRVMRAPTSVDTVAVAPTPHLSERSVNEMLAGAVIDPAGAADAALGRPSSDGRPLSSPLAQRRARERSIDLRTVKGTGRRGRISVQDVLAASRNPSEASRPSPVPSVSHDVGDVPLGYEDVPFEAFTTSAHRRAISEHMRRSRQTSAHMTTEVDVDMFQVAKVRDLMNAAREAAGLGRISYLSFISKAAIAELGEYREMNATFLHERVLQWDEVNLGIAVDTPAGLIVPVIRHAQTMTVEQIADAIAHVAERARARKLVPDELRAGTFTISNPGSVGAVSAPAIINQPQVAILGVPVIAKRVWVVTSPEGSDSVAIRPILRLAVTFDHRAIDGAYATRYAVAVKQHLEEWDLRDYT